jgi:hypothetical protein
MAIVQKMACLDKDYQKYELNQEINLKLNSNNSFDIMRDFQDSKDNKNGENPSTNESKMAGKKGRNEDGAFISLTKLKERMISRSLKQNNLLYRKVMRLDKGK